MHKLGNFTAAHLCQSMFVEIVILRTHVRTWPQVEVIKGVVHFRQMRLPCPQFPPTPSRLPSPAALTTNLARRQCCGCCCCCCCGCRLESGGRGVAGEGARCRAVFGCVLLLFIYCSVQRKKVSVRHVPILEARGASWGQIRVRTRTRTYCTEPISYMTFLGN